MAEQIKFELDSDETFDILKDIGDAENELGKQCWKDGLKAQAIEYFKHEATSLRASQTQQNIVISADRDSTGRRNRREHGINCRVRERRGTQGTARKYYFCG